MGNWSNFLLSVRGRKKDVGNFSQIAPDLPVFRDYNLVENAVSLGEGGDEVEVSKIALMKYRLWEQNFNFTSKAFDYRKDLPEISRQHPNLCFAIVEDDWDLGFISSLYFNGELESFCITSEQAEKYIFKDTDDNGEVWEIYEPPMMDDLLALCDKRTNEILKTRGRAH